LNTKGLINRKSNERDMKSRPPIETASIYLLTALIGYAIADLAILAVRDRWLPTQPPPAKPLNIAPHRQPERGTYNIVTSQNIFNADQQIPPPFGADKNKAKPDAPPVPSQLPLQLIGTIVHVNPNRSIATIQLKNKNDQMAFMVGATIPDGLATVTKIERAKVIFRNMASQRLEFIELKDETKLLFGRAAPQAKQMGEVTQKSDNEFELKRDDVNRLTNNLPELLQQARAVPRMGPGGQIECFNLADIAPGSLYERLGLKRGDCIKSVNGEKIDSPAKAMELYNALRSNASSINLGIERAGRDEQMNYNIQ
jgi:general secretion pathway protein C